MYKCDQCGSSDLVALPIIYEQGTRSFSGRFTSGVSQSMAAKTAAPPEAKRYFIPLILWGLVFLFFAMWTYVGLSVLMMHPKALLLKVFLAVVFAVLALAAFAKLAWTLRCIAHYNHEVYPRLYSDWAHTFMCRRCGRHLLIRP